MAPYNQLSKNFENYKNESITWDQYLIELELREKIMNSLRSSCNIHKVTDSTNFLTNLYAYLHFDNYCWKSLKSNKNPKEHFFTTDRTIIWEFPNNTNVKIEQKRVMYEQRKDVIINSTKQKDALFGYKWIHKNAKMIDGAKVILKNSNEDLNTHMKQNPNKQMLYEIVFSMFGLEPMKNPAAIIYNMMMIDLIDGLLDKINYFENVHHQLTFFNLIAKKADQSEFFDTKEKEGFLPYAAKGSTNAMRFLNIYYSYIFRHWYSYDITDDNEEKIYDNVMDPNSHYNINLGYKNVIETVLKREYDLTYKWITMKAETDDQAKHMRTIQDLWDFLTSHTRHWFQQYDLYL